MAFETWALINECALFVKHRQ